MTIVDIIKGKSVYISGKITGDPDYRGKFHHWSVALEEMGARRIINPVCLLPSECHTYDEFMEVDLMFVRRCDVILMLPDWQDSLGARCEHAFAECLKKQVVFAKDLI